MNNYDLRVLDDKEFESLSVDLLGVLHGCRIERFKSGKDAGVDGRWFTSEDKEIVVQCKHWMRSGYDRLLSHLSKLERPKLDKLKPHRYILVTSVELSRNNKHQIATVLAPYVKSESDVLGREDLDDLLSKNPDVERRHYKLWLASVTVLNHLIHNAVYGRSGFDTTEIREKTPVFVKTSDFDQAERVLNGLHTVIITGVPGIGKTTLAEQLVVKQLAEGFELISLRDITDGESAYIENKNQVFYFDDFLGRNLLEAIKLQHDSQIVGFIRRIHHDKSKRFILTSRSSILNQGKYLSDLFLLSKTEKNEYEVRIEKLSLYEKARILYAHIWHSSLPDEMLGQLFVNKRYKTIAGHRNYNPRLISFITDSDFSGNVPVDKYWDHIVHTLENPQSLWDHFFGQLSQDCRDVVYLVVLNGRSISEHSLMQAFRALKVEALHDVGAVEDRSRTALKICTGSVLNRNISPKTGLATYDLYNPSIADYVFGRLGGWHSFESHFASLRTTASLHTLTVMKSSGVISAVAHADTLDKLAQLNADSPGEEYSVMLDNLVFEHELLASRHEKSIRKRINELDLASFPGHDALLLSYIASGIRMGYVTNANGRIIELCTRLQDWALSQDDFSLLADLVAMASGSELEVATDLAKSSVASYWKDNLRDFVSEADLLRDIYSPSEYDRGFRELGDAVGAAIEESGFAFDAAEVRTICETLDMAWIAERNIEWDQDRDVEGSRPTISSPTALEDQLIDDLFERDVPG